MELEPVTPMTKPTEHEWDVFQLDPDNLDREWLGQAKLYHTYATKLADARAEYERAKARREVVKAELDKDIRLNPTNYGLSSPIREGAVTNTILLQKKYQDAVVAEVVARHDMDIVAAMVKALDHRKRALQDLVQLEARDYFATPRAPVAGKRIARHSEADQVFGSNRKRDQQRE